MINKKFHCEKCNFTTHKRYNLNKHCKTKKHIKNHDSPVSGDVPPKLGDNPPVSGDNFSKKFKCEYCNNEYLMKHKNRHYSRCKSKKDHDVNSEIKELKEITKHLKEELENNEKKMFEFIKTVASTNNSTITNNNTNNTNINNNNYNMYYIINNFTEAENIEDIMKIPFTQEELDYIEKNGSVLGSYNLIKDRCVQDKELSKRPVHCTDISRKKYLLRHNNEWIIDPNADKLLTMTFNKMKDAYNLESDDIYNNLKNTSELIKLDIDGRKKINNQISKDVLLKNEIK